MAEIYNDKADEGTDEMVVATGQASQIVCEWFIPVTAEPIDNSRRLIKYQPVGKYHNFLLTLCWEFYTFKQTGLFSSKTFLSDLNFVCSQFLILLLLLSLFPQLYHDLISKRPKKKLSGRNRWCGKYEERESSVKVCHKSMWECLGTGKMAPLVNFTAHSHEDLVLSPALV